LPRNACLVLASGRTAPTGGASRPCCTRRASSAGSPPFGSTTKYVARPSAGRIFGGKATETSIPPGRTTAAERSSTSPPIVSSTTSTCPATSSKRSLSRSANCCAPPAGVAARSRPRPVPAMRAPASRASWTARLPAAPWPRAPARSALVAGRRGRTAPARPLARLATARQHWHDRRRRAAAPGSVPRPSRTRPRLRQAGVAGNRAGIVSLRSAV